ncbi:MAG: hypothetical protein JO022_19600, partial [Acidobacteriaceae bacterium]|nr:hypothetical protein [Acidobacteriaceae bacterium]
MDLKEEQTDRINVDDVMREIREQARQRNPKPSVPRRSRPIAGMSAVARFPVEHIGDLPPAPPTLRGRLGAIAVRFVYHALEWYTVRLRQLVAALKSDAATHDRSVQQLAATVEENTQEIATLRATIAELQRVQTETAARLEQRSETAVRELERRTYQLRADLTFQERRTATLLEEARKRLPALLDSAQLQSFASQQNTMFDSAYLVFENRYRGTRPDIIERLRVYLPYLAGVKSALDLGCGRGEWLELLGEQNINARGVDSNSAMVECCRNLGLSVTEADFIEHLRSVPDNSLD